MEKFDCSDLILESVFSKYRHPFPEVLWQERFYNLRKVAVCCAEQ